MSPGIPPSPDREDRQRAMLAGAVIIIAAFILLFFVTVFGNGDPDLPGLREGATADERLAAFLAEEVRASAYEALRDHLDQKKSAPDIAAVYCRDSAHRWTGDVIEFRGDVDFERPGGPLDRFRYVATLQGSKTDGWEVLTLELTPFEP